MFKNATAFNQDISSWDVERITDMTEMFSGATAFNQDLSGWNVEHLSEPGNFAYNNTIWTTDLQPQWGVPHTCDTSTLADTHAYKNVSYRGLVDPCKGKLVISQEDFEKARTISGGNLTHTTSDGSVYSVSQWYTGNITSMRSTFYTTDVGLLSDTDISNWDTSKVTDMGFMFFKANNGNFDLTNWDVAQVTSFENAFSESTSSFDLSNWELSSASDMRKMFLDTDDFDGDFGVSSWKIGGNVVTIDMSQLFKGSNFNGDLSNWDVSQVTNMDSMFSSNNVFNQDIGSWDTSKVTDMGSMFLSATAFNQDLSRWNVSNFGSEPTNFNANANATWIGTSAFQPQWGVNLRACDFSDGQTTSFLGEINPCAGRYVINATDFASVGSSTLGGSETYSHGGYDVSQWYTANITDMSQYFKD